MTSSKFNNSGDKWKKIKIEYRDTKGIEILKQCGIVVEKLDSEI